MLEAYRQVEHEDDTAVVYDADSFCEETLVRQLSNVPSVDLPYDDTTRLASLDTSDVDKVRPRAETQWSARLLRQALVGILLRPWSGFEDVVCTRRGVQPDVLIRPTCGAPFRIEAKVARFFEPIDYQWTPELAEIRDLVREFTETIYADH
jgi:hypothetical protein